VYISCPENGHIILTDRTYLDPGEYLFMIEDLPPKAPFSGRIFAVEQDVDVHYIVDGRTLAYD